jgi:chaperonin cofactor prefoldin
MNRSLPNMPLAIDPASKDQPNINRQLTEALLQLWRRINELERRVDHLDEQIKTLTITISTP